MPDILVRDIDPEKLERLKARAKRGHVVLNRVDAFRKAFLDDRFAGDAQLPCKDMNTHFPSQNRSPSHRHTP